MRSVKEVSFDSKNRFRHTVMSQSAASVRITVLLWAIKAKLLNELDETRVEWRPIVRELTRALGIELASSGQAAAF